MKSMIPFIKKYDFPIHVLVINAILRHGIMSMYYTAITRLKLRAFGCSVGRGFVIDGKLWVWAQKRGCIDIKENVRINSRFGSNLVGLTNPAVFQCLGNGEILIGRSTGMSSVVLSARERIRIGNHVKLGGNVRIYDHDFHALDPLARRDPRTDAGQVRSQPVTIGDDVFVGANAIILKGVTIADRAIVRAGSVVACDVPADEIWGGNPAVQLSRRKADGSAT